ncbi:MAG: T9SS type A sorting domain-containing protein [Bacteroidota bacterium]
MKSLLLSFLFLIQASILFSQCNVVATAMGNPASCFGACDGSITFIYQNMAAPGVPYVVAIQNATTGQWLGTTTYTAEAQTIQFSNLCAGNYSINVQGNGCSAMATAMVSQPTAITLYANTVNPSPGQNNGSVNLVAQGGTPPYTYSINGTNYQANSSFSGLSAGSYTGYVQDDNGCIQSTIFVINNTGQCQMVVTANPTIATCASACNASIYYVFTGTMMAPPYLVQLQNPNGQTIQTQTVNGPQGVFTGVCQGTYSVLVTDANGCSGTYSVTVTGAAPPQVTSVNTTPTAFGMSTGTAVVNMTGGTAPYTYSLDGITFQSSNSFNNLAAGVHILTVVDVNGCQTIYCFVIQETQACGLVLTSNPSPASCNGTSSGAITFAYTNAYGPVNVVLQNPNAQTIQSQTFSTNAGQGTFNNLPAGTYIVVVTDAAGCSYSNTVVVSGSTAQLLLTASTVPSASGTATGSITAIVSGGTAPYSYSIGSPGNWQASNVFSGLAPGVYVIWALDANGCTTLLTVQLTQITNCQQAINATASAVTCAGMNNGTINYVYTSGGIGAPFTISLLNSNSTMQSQNGSNSAGSGTFSNVSSGIYYVQLTGANGCVSTTQVYVNQPSQLQITNVVVTNATAGQSNGSAVVSVVGGTAPYTFTINNGVPSSTNNLSGLAAGVQILEVEDANGCTAIYCFVVNESVACQNLVITANQNQTNQCYGSCSGSLAWMYTSGGAPGLYTVTVNHNGATISTTSYTVGAYQGTLGNLCAGQYSITVTDPSGCTATYNLTITAPAPLTLTATATNASSGSSNGSIVATATGGSGMYQYSLDGTTWQTSNTFNNLAAGVHIIYVQDGNNCTQLYTIVIGSNTNCFINLTAMQGVASTCPGACNETISYAFVASNGVGPFVVTVTDQAGNVQTQIQANSNAQGEFTGLCGGAYVVNVTSTNGCFGIYTVVVQTPGYANISVNATDPTPGISDGAFTMNMSGGTPNYEFSIDNQVNWTSNPTFTGLAAGVYIVYSKDANTCTLSTSVKLGESTAALDEIGSTLIAYPNPTNEFVVIEGDLLEVQGVKNAQGQEVDVARRQLTNGQLIDFKNLTKGIYFVSVLNNGKSEVLKIIKE